MSQPDFIQTKQGRRLAYHLNSSGGVVQGARPRLFAV